MSNDWTKFVAVAEITSAIAIVVTLGYLGYQTQQNTAALLSASRQESLNAELGLIYKYGEYPFIFNTQTVEQEESLTDDQKTQWLIVNLALFRIRENLWLQHQNGVLDEATWISYRGVLVNDLIHVPRVRRQWEYHREVGEFNVGFTDEIEDLVIALEAEQKANDTD
jgi:hypothetical protein